VCCTSDLYKQGPLLADTKYLKLRHTKWSVVVAIPRRLQKLAGKREYVKALGTSDLTQANRVKHGYVATFKRLIGTLERGEPSDATADIYELALLRRQDIERQKGRVVGYQNDDRSKPYYASDGLEDLLADEAEAIEDTHGAEAAVRFFRAARGEGTLLHSLVDPWLSEQGDIAGQTRSQHRMVVTALIRWAGGGLLIEEVDRKKAGAFISHLLSEASSLSPKTVKRYASSLSSLWRWLEARGHLRDGVENPWLGQGIARKSKKGVVIERRQWTDAALVKVLSSAATPLWTATLHDLVRLALVTGARLDELCALELRDVQKLSDGWWITIRQGKTASALREVPA
jgi:Domain of unknown function (DUF6538)/Phage integrase, N-terminal SAM-like domain